MSSAGPGSNLSIGVLRPGQFWLQHTKFLFWGKFSSSTKGCWVFILYSCAAVNIKVSLFLLARNLLVRNLDWVSRTWSPDLHPLRCLCDCLLAVPGHHHRPEVSLVGFLMPSTIFLSLTDDPYVHQEHSTDNAHWTPELQEIHKQPVVPWDSFGKLASWVFCKAFHPSVHDWWFTVVCSFERITDTLVNVIWILNAKNAWIQNVFLLSYLRVRVKAARTGTPRICVPPASSLSLTLRNGLCFGQFVFVSIPWLVSTTKSRSAA